MNLTLHLTDRCNLRCGYCFVRHGGRRMSASVARAAVDLAWNSGLLNRGFAFFGGEPLLERELIEETVTYARALESTNPAISPFAYKITTNGLLLDDSFLSFAAACGMEVALSHDGLMHEEMRRMPDGASSLAAITAKIPLLLSRQPNALVMATVCPSTAHRLADSVGWLFDQGFRRVNVMPDARPEAGWDDASLDTLREQYARIAQEYVRRAKDGVSFLPFDEKIRSRLHGRCSLCRLGKKQPSVTPDGKLYPCVQFADKPAYAMGDVFSGVDTAAQERLFQQASQQPAECAACVLQARCRNACACLNLQMTGNMHTVSPFQCEHERILIRYADEAAQQLFAQASPAFLRAFYSQTDTAPVYP